MLFGLKKFVSFWLMPLPFCLVLGLVGYCLLRRPKTARLGRALVIGAVALLMALSNKFVSRALLRPLETQFPALPEFAAGQVPPAVAGCDYVVVFGGGHAESPGMAATNLLSGAALARTVEAVRIIGALPRAKLIVSGPAHRDRPSHASVLARAAQSLGVAADRIILIDTAHDTEDEAYAVKRLVGDARTALVTSAWHLPRTVALCRGAGINALPCPADFRTHAEEALQFDDFLWEVDALNRSSLAVRERLGHLWIWLRGKT